MELQNLLADKDDAVEKVDRLDKAKPGDDEYDDIAAETNTSDVEASVRRVLAELVRLASSPLWGGGVGN